MKKNSFVEGTLIATIAVVLTKIIGVLYVIPFYKIIGEQGGSLYAYAYNVYQIFLAISTAGIPIAISKLISEYNTLEMHDAKNRVYTLGKKMLGIISVILFFLLFVFAREFAVLILGNVTGGNTIEDVVFVVRCVSFSLLVVPFLSISRGYLQGHRFISYPSISQVVEQITRVTVILTGSFLILKVFNGSLNIAVGLSVFAAFLGGLAALIYLKYHIRKNRKELNLTGKVKKDEITNKEITKKIITYSLPLIIVSVATNIYNFIDMVLINRGLGILGFEGPLIESITTITTTWAVKISVIVNSVAIGMCMSLIPYIVESFVKKDYENVGHKFNKALQIIVLTSIPMVVGIIILSNPVFNIFYGNIEYGPGILRIVMVNSFVWNMYMITDMVLQALNKFKLVYILTFFGFGINALLDIPFMLLFDYLGIPAYYGAVFSSIFSLTLVIIIALYKLKNEFKINYKPLLTTSKKMVLPTVSMIVILYLLSFVVKLNNLSFIGNILVCMLYALVGGTIFIIIAFKNGVLYDVLGKEYIDNIISKFKKILSK